MIEKKYFPLYNIYRMNENGKIQFKKGCCKMPELNLKTASGDISTFKKIVSNGISEERKKIEYALERTNNIIKKYEKEHQMSSEEFLQRFQEGEIDENSEFFEWWAELKVTKELEDKLHIVESIEICQ